MRFSDWGKRLLPRDSLRVRLIWQLLLFQAGLLLLLAGALMTVLLRADLGGVLIDSKALDIATRAITPGSDGRLVVTETQEIKDIRALQRLDDGYERHRRFILVPP